MTHPARIYDSGTRSESKYAIVQYTMYENSISNFELIRIGETMEWRNLSLLDEQENLSLHCHLSYRETVYIFCHSLIGHFLAPGWRIPMLNNVFQIFNSGMRADLGYKSSDAMTPGVQYSHSKTSLQHKFSHETGLVDLARLIWTLSSQSRLHCIWYRFR